MMFPVEVVEEVQMIVWRRKDDDDGGGDGGDDDVLVVVKFVGEVYRATITNLLKLDVVVVVEAVEREVLVLREVEVEVVGMVVRVVERDWSSIDLHSQFD